jgi:hypothetical protein
MKEKDLLLYALELPPSERYHLAFLIAESIGYMLTKYDEEDPHEDVKWAK